MSSSESSEPIDLERGHPVTAEDVSAQKRLGAPAIASFEEYMAWIASFPSPSYEQLKDRPGPHGEPFVLSF
jgi:hypothetical protein